MKRRIGTIVKNNGKNTDKQLKKLVNERLVLKLKQGPIHFIIRSIFTIQYTFIQFY